MTLTDAEFNRLKRHIEKRLRFWKDALGLTLWHITPEFFRVPWDGAERASADCLMDIDPDWRYLTAHLRVNVFAVWSHALDDDAIDRVIVHEFLHIHVSELRCLVMDDKLDQHIDHEERVVSGLTLAVFWTFEAGRDAGKRQAMKGE